MSPPETFSAACTPTASDALRERAPAKVNLTLRVLGRRVDGYHELVSLVAFAGMGDRLELLPGENLALTVSGPNAAEAGAGDENLVLRAARHLAERRPGLRVGRFHLVKHLPVAAGLGGGSSDAAAALRLLARANGMRLDDPVLHAAAEATGSDVPVCLAGRSSLMSGRGERVERVDLPRFGLLLVNPRLPVPTGPVFAGLALEPGDVLPGPDHPAPTRLPRERGELVRALAVLPNDLEPPARRLVGQLGAVAESIAATPRNRLTRMSGSGGTFFGLYDNCREAVAAAKIVAARHPGWWVKPTVLG
ncbi:4-(cytidine 5'-diphospho)-2-C-methyl-D-erythritol kinase [Ancylobacter sp. 6x-1]|uniref:4-diphosphocytidyl-2-C-methyl-D-erythritol kinase n=1 Tax=Ancylobacter crimeensis TaxID=2579147 RepID=A0ABT0DFQ7_9HYPH|nr:4-(cytidine 5'-diphospho)-2-C-methyl-D-erythritol kinase [Ancylobacter crimeensis]MCK0198793.1 4-(cytidine 5'-diphospho)-2-C-methyl-D-erythritol kinase [Ancylobacter crimeensis]